MKSIQKSKSASKLESTSPENLKTNKRLYMSDYRKSYSKSIKRVNITLSNSEYEALSYFAEIEKETPTSLARDYVIAGMTGTLRTPKTLESDLKEANRLLRNIANNVNQMAHLSNSLARVVDDNGVLLELSRLETELEAFLQERLRQGQGESQKENEGSNEEKNEAPSSKAPSPEPRT